MARPSQASDTGDLRRPWFRQERLVQLLALGVGLAFVVAAVVLGRSANLTAIGYPGVMFLSFLGSAALVLPVPGLISLCAVSAVLNPFLLGALAGVAETLGEVSGYAIGYGGQHMLQRHRLYERVQRWMVRRGWLVIFVVSVIPNPLFDLVGIAAGGTRYPLPRFLAIVLVGKVLKGLIVGYSCYQGISLLPWVD